jgi:hypothetical protein
MRVHDSEDKHRKVRSQTQNIVGKNGFGLCAVYVCNSGLVIIGQEIGLVRGYL